MSIKLAAVELGSGGIRLTIGETNPNQNQIKNIIFQQYSSLPLMETVAQEKIITVEMQGKIKEEMAKFIALAKENHISKLAGIATEAFRRAKNGKEFIEHLSLISKCKIDLIDQNEEGEIGYKTHAYLARESNLGASLIAWDTGKGSEQISYKNSHGKVSVFMNYFGYGVASQIFAEEIRFMKPQKSYNPVTATEINALMAKLKERSGVVTQELRAAASKGIAVRFHLTPFLPALFDLETDPRVTLQKVKDTLTKVINETDATIKAKFKNRLPDFAIGHVSIFLAMLQHTMQHIGIPAIHYVKIYSESGNTTGMLLHKKLWKEMRVLGGIPMIAFTSAYRTIFAA